MPVSRRINVFGLAFAFALTFEAVMVTHAKQRSQVWHYAPNRNFDETGAFTPARAGFNLADVSTRSQLDLLPDGVKGLVWVGQCDGVTLNFKTIVDATIDHPKLFGFYLMDDPDPTGLWKPRCNASDLRAESDWIHRRRRNAVTFVALMNMGTSAWPRFSAEYAPKNSHVDLFSVGPYPCRRKLVECDFDMIDRYIAASRNAGFSLSRTVPIFQVFGGGDWRADDGDVYRLPNPPELQKILERWNKISPAPVFDFAYSWGQQRSDASLAGSADLQAVFARHNRETGIAQELDVKRIPSDSIDHSQ
jgi:hypothetical protein